METKPNTERPTGQPPRIFKIIGHYGDLVAVEPDPVHARRKAAELAREQATERLSLIKAIHDSEYRSTDAVVIVEHTDGRRFLNVVGTARVGSSGVIAAFANIYEVHPS